MDFLLCDPTSDAAVDILDRYGVDMRARYGSDAPYGSSCLPDGVDADGGGFLVAIDGSAPVGCVGFRGLAKGSCGEIKAMYVVPESRAQGIARHLLRVVERAMVDVGYVTCRLNTGRLQPEAVALYRSSGFVEVDAYNDNPYAAHWFEKPLVAR